MFGSDPLDELVIPDGTHVQEHDLVAEGDVLVGGQSVVELGVRGGNVVAGERVRFDGDIEADGDCRLDMWCDVDGNVLVGTDAYLGERVHISGQLIVSGDLDIGDDVDIERGFEANGWIVIRNPMPTIVFLFVYLSQLLRIGEEEAAEEVVDEFLSEDLEADPVVVPRGARVSDDTWRVSTPARIGDECRLHGNIRATDIEVGVDTEVFGSLRAKEDITVGTGTVVHGDVTTKGGDVVVDPDAHVRGDISCEDCTLSEAAEVDGAIRARGQMSFTTPVESGGSSTVDADDPGFEWEGDDDQRDRDSTEEEAELTRAIVPLGEGDLPEPARPSAVIPVDESEFDWDAIQNEDDRGDPATNGSADEVAGVIAEAEEG